MPKPSNDPNYDIPPSKTIFVSRDTMAYAISIGHPTDAQKEILRASIVKKWPQVYELTRSESVVATLNEIRVSWRDKK